MLVTVPPGGDQTPGNNEGDDWYDQHNLEGVGLSELSAEQLARHTKRENGSDFPIRPSRNETMEEGHHHHHCPGCINEECPGVTAEPGAHYQGARGNQNGKSTVRKPPHLATQHSRRDLKRRREDLERAEQELADAEEREDRDNQNWATHIRKEQENEAWHTAHHEWADQFKGRYLMADDKIPSDDEPTDLRLTEEEYTVRRRRHQRFCEILFALRREFVDRSYEEEQVRHLIHLHENEVWKRGDGEWRTRFHKLLDRLHRIGVEQLRINERIAALSTLAASMAAAEDAQKMANQAMEAVQRAQRANETFVGPRTETWWQRERTRASTPLHYVDRETWETYYQHREMYFARGDTYDNYLENYRRSSAAILNTAVQAAEREALEQQVYYEDDVEVLLRAADGEEDTEDTQPSPTVPTRKIRYM
jgi:hypothetical protein